MFKIFSIVIFEVFNFEDVLALNYEPTAFGYPRSVSLLWKIHYLLLVAYTLKNHLNDKYIWVVHF